MTQNSKRSFTCSRRIITFLIALALVFTSLPLAAFAAEPVSQSDSIALVREYLSQYEDNYVLKRSDLNGLKAVLSGESAVSAARMSSEDEDVMQQDVIVTLLTKSAGMKESQFADGPDDDAYFNYNQMARSAGLLDNWDYDPTALATASDILAMFANMSGAAYSLYAAINAENPEPYFVNGMAVPIFKYGDPKDPAVNYYDTTGDGVARFCVYVESNFDTDGDGKLDLIKAVVQLPRPAVDKGMEVATIFEARPYIAGYPTGASAPGDGNYFDIDEMYAQPAPRDSSVPVTSTQDMVENADYNDWWYLYRINNGTEQWNYEDLNWYDYYLTRGFAVVSAAGPGTMMSEGFSTCGTDLEIDAFKCVIEWLSGDRVAYTDKSATNRVEADWSNGNVGMTGRSYAGTTQFGLSTTGVEGLKTIVPVAGIASWYEYTNNQGVLTRGSAAYSNSLALTVASRYREAAYGDTSDWESIKIPYGNYIQRLIADQNELNGGYGQHWKIRDYTIDGWNTWSTGDNWTNKDSWGPSKIQIPMLIVHGLNDDNVRGKQSDLMYRATQVAGTPVKMIWHQGHHMTPTYPAGNYEMYCGTFNIDGKEVDLLYDDILNLWFSHHLYGVDNNVMEILPEVLAQDNDIVPEGNGSNGWVHYDSWESFTTYMDVDHFVSAPTAEPRSFSAAVEDGRAFDEAEYDIEDSEHPDGIGGTAEGAEETAEAESMAAAAASIDSNIITIDSASGSSNWAQNFLNTSTAGSALYAVDLTEDFVVKGVVEVNLKAALASVGASEERLGVHVKLVEIAAPGTRLNYYGTTGMGSTVATTTLQTGGAWMGGGVENFDLVRFRQSTSTTDANSYREIAKGWIDLCKPGADYDSYTAAREDRMIPSENIGVYHDYKIYLNPAVHTAKKGNKLALIITTAANSAQNSGAISGNNAFTYNIDTNGTYIALPSAYETSVGKSEPFADVLRLSTDAHLVKPDGYANITTEFTKTINSNTAILNYTFDTELFEFADFHPETGVQVVSKEATEDGAKVVVMIPSYNTQTYGRLAIHAKADAPLTTGRATVKVRAEYVVKDDETGDKEIRYATASTSFTTIDDERLEGDTNFDGVVDLIDLSNMIDWFGLTDRNAEWEDFYTYFDFNNNGEIDIFDIAEVARLIK